MSLPEAEEMESLRPGDGFLSQTFCRLAVLNYAFQTVAGKLSRTALSNIEMKYKIQFLSYTNILNAQ